MNAENSLDRHIDLVDAVQRSDSDEIHCLVSRGASVRNIPPGKKNPLITASIIGEYNIVQTLLDYKADPNVCDRNRDTPLHWASFMGNHGAVQRLIQAKADVEAVGFKTLRPVEVAIERQNPEIVQVFRTMHYGPLLRNISDELKSTSLCTGVQSIILDYCTPRWW